jgi:hypothetical protein
MTSAEVLDKIRKLLALSRGTPNPGEAETAMAIVQRLLLEHGLTLLDAAAGGDAGFLCEAVWRAERMPVESSFVWGIVEDFFFCFPIRSGNELLVVGRPEHVAVGKYVAVYLSRTFRALWSAYRSERRGQRPNQRAYFLGLRTGITLRLAGERRDLATSRPELGALIRRHDVELSAEVLRQFGGRIAPGRSMKINDDGHAFSDGVERGKKIGIRTPLAAPPERRGIGVE